jgi:hypothetical protein
MPRWRVYSLPGAQWEFVGFVKAETEDRAIEEAIKLFRIDPALRDTLKAVQER